MLNSNLVQKVQNMICNIDTYLHSIRHHASNSLDTNIPFIGLNAHAERYFKFDGNKYMDKAFIDYDRTAFVNRINELYNDSNNGIQLIDGYAPFCKHLFVPNFVNNIPNSVLKINDDNVKYLKSDYVSRRDSELPVLVRWFDKKELNIDGIKIDDASYLDIILYSREQINKENKAMNISNDDNKSEWGIVSIKAQNVNFEIPMEPITMMRNGLPLNQGGSGKEIDSDQYRKSVEFWKGHARVQ